MPLYDCGDPECSECQRAFGPDRSKAIANYRKRETAYAELPADPVAPAKAKNIAKFVKQQYGAVVATILDNENEILEVLKRSDGTYELTVHNRRETDRWDDMSVTLRPEHFEGLGSIADQHAPADSETMPSAQQ